MNPNPTISSESKITNFRLLQTPKLNSLPPSVNAAELLADQSQIAPNEILQGLVHQGTKVVLGGSSKAGKTWLLLMLAVAVATGTKFLRWGAEKGRVLFLNFEIPTPFIFQRLRALVKHLGIEDLSYLDIWNLRGKTADSEALVRQILEKAQQNEYAIIILDPVYKLMIGKNENTAGGVGALCHQLERIAERTGAAVVYAHHFTKGKQTQKKPIDRLSGSGVFGRDADSIILFTDHQEQGCFTVDLILRNLPPQESFVAEWVYPVMVEREDLEPEGEEEKVDPRREILLKLLLAKPLTTGEWEDAAKLEGIPRASFFRTKGKLKESGSIIQNPKDKTWTVAAGLVETSDTADTCAIEDNAGSINSLTVSPVPAKTEMKLLCWPENNQTTGTTTNN